MQFDVQMTPQQLADKICSGEAREHDLYWAYYTASDKGALATLEKAPAVRAFRELERALSLSKANSPPALSLWAGPAGHVEYLHYDDDDNLHLVVCPKGVFRGMQMRRCFERKGLRPFRWPLTP